MSSDTYSNSRLFIGDKEIIAFDSVQYTESGKSNASTLNVSIPDPELKKATLENKEIRFFLNYGSLDSVPFFRGLIKQVTPTENNIQIVASDVRSLLTGNESIPLSLTDKKNYDGYTLGQFIHSYVNEFVNIKETIIGLDMLNDTSPVVSLTGTRGEVLSPLKIIKDKLPNNKDSLTDIRANRLVIKDDGNKSNICFVKEQSIDDAGVPFSYSDGVRSVSVKKRKKPNLLSTVVDGRQVIYKHNNFSTGISGGKIQGNYEYPDEAIQAAYVQAKQSEIDSEITLNVTKGHYLDIGNVVKVYIRDNPDITGKHRIQSKQVTCTKSGVTCTLQLAKEKPQVSDYLSS
tara:strand:- start:75 stop:1109 length:1035 start_codon:yes stop_codon:yes gene_type:complete